MLYRRNRYFDPVSGRFTQQDPIGVAGGMNLYGFANGDPVNFSDPFGLLECSREKPKDCTLLDVLRNVLAGIGATAGGDITDRGPGFRTGVALGLITTGSATGGLRRAGIGAAAADSRILLQEGDALLAVVKDGRIIAKTSDVALSHTSFVNRALGGLPEGARVVTIGKFEGSVRALNSRTFHGNQLPAPQDVQSAVGAFYR